MMLVSGARIVAETLIEQGCDTVFGYPGGQVIDIFDELYRCRDRIRHILTAHEQGAAHAADGYARASGKVGAVIATSGPGATNLVTGIATAFLDSVPLVAVTGNVSCGMIGRDSFQEVDIVGITMPVTKHNFIVKDVHELADTLRLAFRIAKSGRPGPVLVDIPKDVQTALADFVPEECPTPAEPVRTAAEQSLVRAAEMMQQSRRPYILFGGGILAADASCELLSLAERLDAQTGCTLMGLSAVPTDHPRFLGMQGMHGHYASNLAEYEADLVIALGMRFSDRAADDQGRFKKGTKLIHIDIDNAELYKNVPVDLAIRGDLRDALGRLLTMLPQQLHEAWTARCNTLRNAEKRRVKLPKPEKGTLSPYDIIDTVQKYAGDAVYVTDVGQHQMWAAQRCRLTKPRTFLTSGGLGTMGFGLGAAIGAAKATGKQTVLFTGDGSFGMNLTELAAAVSQQAPVVIVVFHNGTLGMVRQLQRLDFDGRYSATTLDRASDFVKIAEGFGAAGMRVSSLRELDTAVQTALRAGGPYVIDCPVSPDFPVLPMLPHGGIAANMITEIK